MKVFYTITGIILLALFLFVAWANYFVSDFSSGGMGGGEVYRLDCSRQELYSGLKSYYAANPLYHVPAKWINNDYTKQNYYKDFEGVSFYFTATETEPEEMYFITLVSNDLSDTTYTKPSYVAVRIVTDSKKHSKKEDDEYEKAERKRTDRRFKENILDKFNTDSCSCKIIGIRGDNYPSH